MGLFEAMRNLARLRDPSWIELERGTEKFGQAIGGVSPDLIISITGIVGFGIPILIVFWIAGPNVRRMLWLFLGASIVWLPSLLKFMV